MLQLLACIHRCEKDAGKHTQYYIYIKVSHQIKLVPGETFILHDLATSEQQERCPNIA
jgi:hypothetical protein